MRGRKAGQGKFSGGRPSGTTLPEYLHREPLHEITLPRWIKRWLLSHPRQAGRMIEKALLAMFGEELLSYKQKADGEQSHEADSKPPA